MILLDKLKKDIKITMGGKFSRLVELVNKTRNQQRKGSCAPTAPTVNSTGTSQNTDSDVTGNTNNNNVFNFRLT